MKPIKLHIIAFDVPYPADYGGVIDVFYKIKYLGEAGVEIYLHCFEYGRGEAIKLEQYCNQVWYYKRIKGWRGISLTLPYIVSSRNNKKLLERLREIDAPILIEGIHSSFYINHPELNYRKKFLRIHNLEYEYYYQLFKKEQNLLKKIFFKVESLLLKKYEHSLKNANIFLALSFTDYLYFKNLYPEAQHIYLPPFHNNDKVILKQGKGDYCLYQGNLSHPENIEAAKFIINNLVDNINFPFIFAGKNPTQEFINLCNKHPNCTLIPNPKAEEMFNLIQNAQVNLLPTFQQSGVKLKLLAALFCGRHAIVNKAMLYGTGLQENLTIAETKEDWINSINELKNKAFTENDIKLRNAILKEFNNTKNAEKLTKLIH